jgi:uncharacterized membrane protein
MSKQQSLLVALIVSIALNLLVAGAFIGRWTRPAGPPPLSWALESVAPETREQLRGKLRGHQAEVRPLRENMRRAMQVVRAAAATEPLDTAALTAALESARDAQQRYQAFLHSNVVDVLASLPVEQRMAVLQRTLEQNGRGEQRKRPHPPGPP